MYKIVAKQVLNPTVVRMEIQAPYVAKKAQAGQFVILRVDDRGERIPLTVADYNRTAGTVTIIFQLVGATTKQLARLEVGDSLQDFVGPLGNPTKVTGYRKVAVVGGGVGCAIAYPVAKALHENGAQVHSIVGFRTKDLVILQQEFEKVSDRYVLMSDDGSVGEKGLVTNALESLIQSGEQYDLVIAIGPLVMMKFVCKTTEKYGIHTVVSMNPIMIDGTGMCGGCRLLVGGSISDPERGYQIRFALEAEDAVQDTAGVTVTVMQGAKSESVKINSSVSQQDGGVVLSAALTGSDWQVGKAELTIRLSETEYDCCLPVSALHSDNGGDFVYSVEERNTILGLQNIVRKVYVEVVERNNELAALRNYTTGAPVVAATTKSLQEGARVRTAG